VFILYRTVYLRAQTGIILRVKQRIIVLAAIAAAVLFGGGGLAAAQGIYPSGSTGVDVSYPNCSSSISNNLAFGIVGVTGGLNFHPNSCLSTESAHFKNLSFYTNTGYPGLTTALNYQNSPKTCATNDLNCLAYNYGYNAGQYAVSYAQAQGVWSSTWWLDVETMNTWSSDTAQNIQSLQGQTDALKASGAASVGVYSTTAQWGSITGGWKNGFPSWGATTWQTARQAKTYCTGHEFTGGPTYLIQFRGKLDQDYAC
jgi:hypothetical protein